jgi:hypothetical protein
MAGRFMTPNIEVKTSSETPLKSYRTTQSHISEDNTENNILVLLILL